MASLFKRGSRYYASFYDASRTPSRKQVSLRTTIKREAERRLADLEEAYDAGRFDPWNPQASKPEADLGTLSGAVAAFIDSRANLSPGRLRQGARCAPSAVTRPKPARRRRVLVWN